MKVLSKICSMILVVALLVSLCVGCGKNEKVETKSTESTTSDNALSIGLVFSSGGRGDNGINDMMYNAMEKVCIEKGWECTALENDTASNVEPSTRQFCEQEKDVIISFGFGCIDTVNKLAVEYPEIKFVTIDAVTNELPNVKNFVFKEHEGAFLVGAIAGLMTETGKIGFVGGMENDMIIGFEAGFTQGAKYVNPDVEVLSGFCGSTVAAFIDPTKGKEIALSHYDAGVDIVFQAAGSSGLGVFEAAIQEDKWVIGVDTNQQALAPDNMITSMLKKADTAIECSLVDLSNGIFESGLQVLGVAESGVDFVNDETNEGKIPEDVVTQLEEVTNKIKSGEIVVSTTNE